jgi:hypothetical protein
VDTITRPTEDIKRHPGRPPASTLTDTPPSAHTPLTDRRTVRLSELMARARSKRGIDAFQIAELALLRGLPASSPLRVIFDRATL